MALDPVKALTKLVNFDVQASCLFELTPGSRGCERGINDNREGDDPLGAVHA
jgi:hypothetical protein